MSILMDALKQQLPTTTPAPSRNLWRNVALALGVLLALMLGAAAGYLLQPALPSRVQPNMLEPAAIPALVEAKPEQILAALGSLELTLEASSASVTTEEVKPKFDLEATKQPAIATEILPSTPAIVTVTAETAEKTGVSANSQAEEVVVSAALQDKFSLAIQATENRRPTATRTSTEAPAADVSELALTIRQTIPSIAFEAHVYATSARQRWVKVNGKTLQENQWLTADIKIKEITAQYVLLEYGNTLFSMAALSSWSQG
jgi:general secretion pathway protein B